MSPQPYVFPESASPQLKVVQDYIKYVAIFDFEKLSTLTTEDLVYKTRPRAWLRDSLNGVPFTVKNEPLDLEIVFFFEFGVGPRALKITSFTEFLDTKRYLELNPES
ncbi:hypothetical protein BJV77DRAFT_964028 [Russula vinacea]|nr:hypothetical protein BJV77DRAFT_964028 [Russula vinacea]